MFYVFQWGTFVNSLNAESAFTLVVEWLGEMSCNQWVADLIPCSVALGPSVLEQHSFPGCLLVVVGGSDSSPGSVIVPQGTVATIEV